MKIEEFKDMLFDQAKIFGFSDYELYYTASNSFSVRIFGGEITEYKNADAVGVSFRGTYKSRIGYAFSERIDGSIIPKLLDNAAGNAQVIEEEEIERLYPGDPEYPEVDMYNPDLSSVTVEAKINMALSMEKYAQKLDPRVKSIDYCGLGTTDDTVMIANSYGLDVTDRSNFAYAYVQARVEDSGVTKNGYEQWLGNDFGKFSYEAISRVAVDRAVALLGAKSVVSGEYPVIFDNLSAIDLFSAFIGIFYAENAQKGFSLLSCKVGELIASPAVTVRDDGVCMDSFGSVAFDSEGVATQKKIVIESGVLNTLLYNTKSAAKDGVKSTGNGFKPGFRASVGTSCTNFYLMPSKTTREEMLEGVGNGLLITGLEGLHSGTNPISGDFSLSAEGFVVEGGKIGRAVEQITVAGNFYTLLKEIIQTGNDLRFNIPGTGCVGMPSFLVSKLSVAGL